MKIGSDNLSDDPKKNWMQWGLRPGRDGDKAQLEAELELLRPLKRLDTMTEAELTRYGGAVATAMVIASNERLEEAIREAEAIREEAERDRDEIRRQAEHHRSEVEAAARDHRADADAYATRTEKSADAAAEETLTEAKSAAQELREEAEANAAAMLDRARADAERTTTEAHEQAERTTTEAHEQAEQWLQQAQREAAETQERARGTGEDIVAEAITRRDELLETIEQQRRWVNGLVADVSELRSSTIGAVNEVRSLTEAVASRLTAYADRGQNVLGDVETQAARLRSISPTRKQDKDKDQDQSQQSDAG